MNPFIDYFNYIKDLRKACKSIGLSFKKIGEIHTKAGTYPLYVIVHQPNLSRKFACISAGIHGNEIAGPLSVLEFVRNQKDTIKECRSNVIIFPVINPVGFDKNRRINYKNFDLNRHSFDKNPPKEIKLLLKFLRYKNIVFFLSLHEDIDAKEFYIIYHYRRYPIYNKLLRIASKYCPLMSNKTWEGDAVVKSAILDTTKKGYMELFMHKKGVNFNVCTETPMKLPLSTRIKCNSALVDFIFNLQQVSL
ncbi:MAG: DUF2817 domain-containing protein [Patescibacteria group bacterium]